MNKLRFRDNKMSHKGLGTILKGVEMCSLRTLDFGQNFRGDPSACKIICDFLMRDRSVEEISFGNAQLVSDEDLSKETDAGRCIYLMLQRNACLTSILLGENDLNNDCLKQIAQGVEENKRITRLSLAQNALSKEDPWARTHVPHLSSMILKSNLQTLHVGNVDMSGNRIVPLVRALASEDCWLADLTFGRNGIRS